MIHVAIVVGHTPRNPGARGADGVHEHEWCGPLATQLHEALSVFGVTSAVYQRPEGVYDAAMGTLTRGINAARPRLVVELHFDALDGARTGSAGLHWPTSTKGRRAAALLSAAAANCIGIRDRGAIAQERSWERSRIVDGRHVPDGRELRILQWTVAPAVILETHYGDTASDHTAATAARDDGRLPRALAAAIVRLLRVL